VRSVGEDGWKLLLNDRVDLRGMLHVCFVERVNLAALAVSKRSVRAHVFLGLLPLLLVDCILV